MRAGLLSVDLRMIEGEGEGEREGEERGVILLLEMLREVSRDLCALLFGVPGVPSCGDLASK